MKNKCCKLISKLPAGASPQTAPETWECAFSLMDNNIQGHVLVAGAGRGGLSWILENSGFEVTSIDLHPEHFVIKNMDCSYADLNEPLEFSDSVFDMVLAVEVFEHLENPWPFLRESIRVLKPGGKLIFTSPNVENLLGRLTFLRNGLFPYFREESFVGCYHVTPIFSWAIERCCRTTNAIIERTGYSRFDRPSASDVPHHDGNKGIRRKILDSFPLNKWTGEIAGYKIKKVEYFPSISKSQHTK